MVLDKICQVFRTDAATMHTMPEHHIFTLPLLPSIAEEEEDKSAKTVITFSILNVMTFTILGIIICI